MIKLKRTRTDIKQDQAMQSWINTLKFIPWADSFLKWFGLKF